MSCSSAGRQQGLRGAAETVGSGAHPRMVRTVPPPDYGRWHDDGRGVVHHNCLLSVSVAWVWLTGARMLARRLAAA